MTDALAVWNSLPKTATNSDSVAVLKSRLKTVVFAWLLSSLMSVSHCLTPALLKLQPYGAIQMRLLLSLFFDPGTQLPGNEKNYAMQYKKYKSQAKIFIILLIIFLTPVLNSQGIKKLRYAIQKNTKIKLE